MAVKVWPPFTIPCRSTSVSLIARVPASSEVRSNDISSTEIVMPLFRSDIFSGSSVKVSTMALPTGPFRCSLLLSLGTRGLTAIQSLRQGGKSPTPHEAHAEANVLSGFVLVGEFKGAVFRDRQRELQHVFNLSNGRWGDPCDPGARPTWKRKASDGTKCKECRAEAALAV